MLTSIPVDLPEHHYRLMSSEVASHSFLVSEAAPTMVTFYHWYHNQRQDLSIEVWLSEDPEGDWMMEVPYHYRQVHPLEVPFTFLLTHADIASRPDPLVLRRLAECNGVVFTDRNPLPVASKNVVFVRAGRAGIHFVNFRNLTGRDNGYYVRISEP